MAYSDGRIFVLEAGLAAEIPWHKIRSWTWEIAELQALTTIGAADLGMKLGVLRHNREAARLQRKKSGFTVTVTHIEKPEWHFTTVSADVCKRWDEILQQMKEGRLPAR